MKKLVCPRLPQFQACVSPLGQLHSRPLFGGYSLAIEDTVFAMVAEGNIYLKACKTGSTIWSRARTVKSPLCYNRLACCWRCCLKSAACSSGYTLKRNNRCPLAGSRPFQKLLTPWRRERGGMDANDSPLQRQQQANLL